MREAVEDVNSAIGSGSLTSLLRALQSEYARFSNIKPENIQWYKDVLSKAIKDKAESEVSKHCKTDMTTLYQLTTAYPIHDVIFIVKRCTVFSLFIRSLVNWHTTRYKTLSTLQMK